MRHHFFEAGDCTAQESTRVKILGQFQQHLLPLASGEILAQQQVLVETNRTPDLSPTAVETA
jgi:hypothetical protein